MCALRGVKQFYFTSQSCNFYLSSSYPPIAVCQVGGGSQLNVCLNFSKSNGKFRLIHNEHSSESKPHKLESWDEKCVDTNSKVCCKINLVTSRPHDAIYVNEFLP